MLSFKEYLHNTSGNFSLFVAIGASALLISAGAAIEMGNMTRVKNELQSQVDIATLAAASTATDKKQTELDYSALTYDVMVDNGYLASNGKPEASAEGSFLNVTATIKYAGLFTDLLGGKSYNLSASAQSTLPSIENVEMVLVLDNTASMGYDGKIGALKIGTGKIVEAVEDSGSGAKIGIVPFARYINVGDASGNWLDTPAEYDTERTWDKATHSGGDCTTEPVTRITDGVEHTYDREVCTGQTTTYEPKTKTIESRFEGCVGTADEPNHLNPISSSNRVIGLLNKQPIEKTGLSNDVEAYCPLDILPMDNDYNAIGDHINKMWPTDVTYIPSGLMWGERLFDRSVAFKQDPKIKNIRQVMVLMTDGKNTAEIRDDTYYQDRLQAPPYIYTEHGGNETVPKADADTLVMCDRIKAKNIELYTISFKIDDSNAKALVKECATSASHNFDAGTNDSLIEAFEQIGKGLASNVRLTQ